MKLRLVRLSSSQSVKSKRNKDLQSGKTEGEFSRR